MKSFKSFIFTFVSTILITLLLSNGFRAIKNKIANNVETIKNNKLIYNSISPRDIKCYLIKINDEMIYIKTLVNEVRARICKSPNCEITYFDSGYTDNLISISSMKGKYLVLETNQIKCKSDFIIDSNLNTFYDKIRNLYSEYENIYVSKTKTKYVIHYIIMTFLNFLITNNL
jgi:hypothetical protein